jgi:hypothetical protein
MKLSHFFGLLAAGSIAFISCKKDTNTTPAGPGVSGLGCATATFSASAYPGSSYTGTATVSYSGGNGTAYSAGTAISSTGVTGLTATLAAGTLASGTGNLTFNITGTPAANGTAVFPISFGGQSCSISLTVAPAYSGKWNQQSYYDTVYNWQELVYNNNLQIDSVVGPINVSTSGAYFQFNTDNSYTWKTTGTTTDFGYGTILRLLNGPVTGDTTDLYIYTLSGSNMVLNRFYGSLVNGGADTIVRDRYYVTTKQP